MFGACGVFRNAYVPKDTNHTMFSLGQKDIGLFILDEVNKASPMAYSQLKTEYMSEASKEKENVKNDD